jgi:acyl carrier protein
MVFEAIARLIAEHNDCDVSEITMDSKFSDLGIDSLDTVEMIMNLEDEVGYEIELDEKVETVGDLVRFVESKKP